MSTELIKVTMHSTALKFGRVLDGKKPLLKDQLRDSDRAAEATGKGITAVGYQLTYAQDRALHAVQTLLDETDYKGNAPPVKPSKGRRYHFEGTLPVIEVKTTAYLEAYGVKKSKTRRGEEFSPQARRIAVGALRDLADEHHLLVYEKSKSKRSRSKVRVEAIGPLVILDVLNGGRRLKIVPNPVLVDQVDSYCILKPVDLFAMTSDKDPVKIRFLEFLLYRMEQNRRMEVAKKATSWEIRLQFEAIVYHLRLDAMLRARKRSQLRKKVKSLYNLGVKVGYLWSYDMNQPGTKRRKVDVLRLNKRAFPHLVPARAKSTTRKRNPSYRSEQADEK